MRIMVKKVVVLLLALLVLLPVAARAQEPVAPLSPPPALLRTPWTDPTGKGVAIGYDIGLWGRAMGQSLRIRVPFLRQHWCLVTRALGAVGPKGNDGTARALDYGGSFELQGQSDVYLNLIRLYGGGGVEVVHGYRGADRGHTTWTGRYEFGFEFFLSPRMSFTLEVGGNGFGTSLTEGPTVFAGLNLYTGLLR
jgi:hypothetical protein